MADSTTYTADDGLRTLTIDCAGNPNGVRLEHTNDGVRIVASFVDGVTSVSVTGRALSDGQVAPEPPAEEPAPEPEPAAEPEPAEQEE